MAVDETALDSTTLSKRYAGVMFALAGAGLVVSGYLAVTSLTAAGPIGCGGGSGCGQVLASKWAKVGPMPVGAMAAVVYAAVILLTGGVISGSAAIRRWMWIALSVAAGLLVGAAGWFIYLQLAVVGAVCPYCMADHAIGVALAALILAHLWQSTHRRRVMLSPIGLLLVAGLATVQSLAPAPVYHLDLPTAGDFDVRQGDQRILGLLGGQLQLNLAHEPLLGRPDAQHVIALIYDHACPHCQHTHHVLQQMIADQPGRIAVVLLPIALNPACNPAAPAELPERFDESCERLSIALAVFAADPDSYAAFDRWMFDAPTYRTAAEARDKAEQLIGREALDSAIAGDAVRALIERNTQAYRACGAGRVPVVMAPGASPIEGRVEDASGIEALLRRSSDLAPAAGPPTNGK